MTRNASSSTRRLGAIAVTTLIAVAVSALAGCSLIDPDPGLLTLTETSGMFHIEVPATWSGRSEQGLIVTTDSEELPADVEAIDTFWLLVYPSADTTDVAPAEYLPTLVEARATERAWQDAQYGEVADAQIGDRPAVMMTASGKDAAGTAFEGQYYLVRTSGRDIIVAAIAPAGELSSYAEEIDTILTQQWYWHQPDTSSGEASEADTAE